MSQTYRLMSGFSESKTGLFTSLDSYRLFQIKGPDAEKFLQGQLTADIASLSSRGHSLAAHCNIKGHMLSMVRLFRLSSEHYLASIHQSIAESGFNNLKKYSIFSKVELGFVDGWSGVALDKKHLEKLNSSITDMSLDANSLSDVHYLAKIDEDLYELWAEDKKLCSWVDKALNEQTSINNWKLGLIQRGIPSLEIQTQEHFIPQMTNLQAVNGVSFSKGCYTGQEIVIRLQHRGVLKKAMYRFSADTVASIEPSSQVVDAEGKVVGEVVSSAITSESKTEILAVVQQRQIDAAVPLKLETGDPLTQLTLPYTLDPRLFESKR